MIQVDTPSSEHHEERMDAFDDNITKLCDEAPTYFTIVCGDFNSKRELNKEI